MVQNKCGVMVGGDGIKEKGLVGKNDSVLVNVFRQHNSAML